MTHQIESELPRTKAELPLSREQFHDLTGQVFGAYRKLDAALVQTLRLTSDMVETADIIGLEPETGQLLFSDFSACLDNMVETRQKLLKAHRRAHVIRLRSKQAKEGCPPPGVVATSQVVTLAAVA